MKQVMIVEDDAAVARGLKDNLAYEGLAVTVDGSAEAGIERLRAGLPADGLTLSARPRWPLDPRRPALLGAGKKGAKA